MSTYPRTVRADFIQWCQVHGSIFVENAPAIGLSAGQAEAFDDLTLKAMDAILAQNAAIQAARVATETAKAALSALRIGAGDTVRTIRAFAENSRNPNTVYTLAQIAPPADRAPTPPPATPTRLSASLDATTGALTIRWKAAQPMGLSGTTYLVRRRLMTAAGQPVDAAGAGATPVSAGETAFTFIGATGAKAFVDGTLPSGVEQAQYTVQAVRGKRTGAVSAILSVQMGSASAAKRVSDGAAVSRAARQVAYSGRKEPVGV